MNNISHKFSIAENIYEICKDNIQVTSQTGEVLHLPIFESQLFSEIETNIRFLSLHIVHDCIMNCEYCYGEGGKYGKDKAQKMSQEIAFKAVDVAFKNIGNNNILHINFFGGEPLLAFDLLEAVVEYSKVKAKQLEKKVGFSVSTSGLIITPKILELLSSNNFSVSVSIDGNRYFHNIHRKTNSQRGTYDIILENVKKIQDLGITLLDTATITHKTVEALADIDSLLSCGITNFRFKTVTGNVGDMTITQGDVNKICNIYDQLCVKYLKDIQQQIYYDFGDYTKWIHRLNKGLLSYSNCTAGRNYYNIDPGGNIFLCHKYVSDNNNIIGHINDGKFPIITHHVDNTPCSKCWAKYICGGGCFYDGWTKNNNSLDPSNTLKCLIYKKQIEGAIMIYSELVRLNLLDVFISKITSTRNDYQNAV